MDTPGQNRTLSEGSSKVPHQSGRTVEIFGDEERVNESNGVIPEDEDIAFSSDDDEERYDDVRADSGIL